MPRARRFEAAPRTDSSAGRPGRRGQRPRPRRTMTLAALLSLGAWVVTWNTAPISAQSLALLGSSTVSGVGPPMFVRAFGKTFAVLGAYDDRQLELRQDNTGQLLDTIDVGGKPTDIAVLEDGTLAVSLEEGEVALFAVVRNGSGYGLEELDRASTGGTPTTNVAVGFNEVVIVTNRGASGSVRSFRTEDRKLFVVDNAPAGFDPHVVSVSRNGIVTGRGLGVPSRSTAAEQSLVAVANDGSNDLTLLAVDKNGNLDVLDESFPLGARPRTLRFSPDGRFLFVALAIRTAQQAQLQDEIAIYQVGDNGALSTLGRTFAGRFLTDLEVVPDGLVAVTVNDNTKDEVRTYRRQGGELTLDASLETPGVPGLPPSFKKLAVDRDCGSVESTRILVGEYQAGRVRSLSYTPSDPSPSPCATLAGDRFQVRVDWSVPSENRSGVATASPVTDDTGSFWFFDPANVELVVKVLDARVINGHFWVFYGALSDVEYTITVTDTETGAVRTYFNPAGTQASGADVQAFPDLGAATLQPSAATATAADVERLFASLLSELAQEARNGQRGESAAEVAQPRVQRVEMESAAGAACSTTSTALCLAQSRFEVRVDWSAPGQGGAGNAVSLSTDTGYFWFFDAANVELIVKVLDARVINGKFWVYYGALSDVEYTITVTDTVTGAQKTYSNPSGNLGSGADTEAF